jgi:ankyrin repeat protein
MNELDHELIEAIKKSNVTKAKHALKKGANVNVILWKKDHSLAWSSRNGLKDIVDLLLEYGADIHRGNNESLQQALENGHIEIARSLLEHGARINDEMVLFTLVYGQFDAFDFLLNYVTEEFFTSLDDDIKSAIETNINNIDIDLKTLSKIFGSRALGIMLSVR